MVFPFGVDIAFARLGDAFFTAFPACSDFVSFAKALAMGPFLGLGCAWQMMPLRVGFCNQSSSFFFDKICASGITMVSS